jgi:hypothetical protein
VLADGWYSWLTPSFRPLTDLTDGWPEPLKAALRRVGALRAVVLFAAGTRYAVTAVTRSDSGWRSLLLLRAVFGRRRKLVVLQFIDHPPRTSGLGALLDRMWRPVDRWATRRALLAAQVLSPGERRRYAARFGIEEERFRLIPFAWRLGDEGSAAPASTRSGVVSVGRAYCDWPTLFSAAREASWPLTVVCGEHDRELVERLNADGRATVLTEIPAQSARQLIAQASVCVLTMVDQGISHGQIRLCDAVSAGTPVVASRTQSLDGYVEDGSTAVLVSPGDAGELRRAVEELLADPDRRERMARAALDRAASWTTTDYVAAIERFVHEQVGR